MSRWVKGTPRSERQGSWGSGRNTRSVKSIQKQTVRVIRKTTSWIIGDPVISWQNLCGETTRSLGRKKLKLQGFGCTPCFRFRHAASPPQRSPPHEWMKLPEWESSKCIYTVVTLHGVDLKPRRDTFCKFTTAGRVCVCANYTLTDAQPPVTSTG